MKPFLLALLILLLTAATGCGYSFFAAKTTVVYETPDGRKIHYTSDKEQQNLDVRYALNPDGTIKEIRIRVDKAGAQDEAITAALQQSQANSALMQALMPMLLKLGAMGAGS